MLAEWLLNLKKYNKIMYVQHLKYSELTLCFSPCISLPWLFLHDWIALSLHSAYANSISSTRDVVQV